jgi:diguanylate cyclase (GGDEF)-like protein
MDDIFAKEEEIIKEAESFLAAGTTDSASVSAHYAKLLDEYKKLLKQTRSMVRMSDKVQGRLCSRSNDLEVLSNIDELTGLYNRRFFNELFQREWVSAIQMQLPLGMLMIDIDCFKQYNDTYGHMQGDICLREIAGAIKEAAHYACDYVARFGGEEFVVLLPDTSFEGCARVAQRILESVKALNVAACDILKGKVSVSVGSGSVIPTAEMQPDKLLNMADKALYRAKADGRNCYREGTLGG